MLSRQPPARVVLDIDCQCHSAWRRQVQHGQQTVHAICRQSGNKRRFKVSTMESLFIHGRLALADASDLISNVMATTPVSKLQRERSAAAMRAMSRASATGGRSSE